MENKEERSVKINGKNYPANLQILMEGKNINDYRIVPVYFLELKHGLMGSFPALLTGSKRMVITMDKDLIKKVWEKLPPRDSKIQEELFYVHKNDPIGYPAKCYLGKEEAIPYQLLTEEEFQDLLNPFRWKFGLIGPNISQEEFTKIILEAVC